VHSKPIVDAGPDRVMITGDSIKLNGRAEGEGLDYEWKPGIYVSNDTILNPLIKPVSDIGYTLAAVSKYGCASKDETFVKVVQDIFIPNAFTPNGDGKNDSWKIPFLDPSFGAEVMVFNRYGELVYHSKGIIVSWDGTINGKQQPTGTYVYMVTIKPGSFQRIGTFTLIR
jgi:gliding motility-associated-like protein